MQRVCKNVTDELTDVKQDPSLIKHYKAQVHLDLISD